MRAARSKVRTSVRVWGIAMKLQVAARLRGASIDKFWHFDDEGRKRIITGIWCPEGRARQEMLVELTKHSPETLKEVASLLNRWAREDANKAHGPVKSAATVG